MSSIRDIAVYLHVEVIHGHHVYKTIWIPAIGEFLQVGEEPTNVSDRRAVALLTSLEIVVGHVPKIFWLFINHGATIRSEVSVPKKCGKGLEVSFQYKLLEPETLVRNAKLSQPKRHVERGTGTK